VATVNIPGTGSLSVYTTVSIPVPVPMGVHKFRILCDTGEFDLNWINFPQLHVRNNRCGEVVRFRMWDGLNGIEYGAVEEINFFSDGVVGNAANPFLLHPAGGIQDVILAKGWTWISVNKTTSDMGLARSSKASPRPHRPTRSP